MLSVLGRYYFCSQHVFYKRLLSLLCLVIIIIEYIHPSEHNSNRFITVEKVGAWGSREFLRGHRGNESTGVTLEAQKYTVAHG